MRHHVRFELARAVARDGRARMLSAENRGQDRVDLEAAVAADRAYFVVPRDDLLVVDLDLPADATRSADMCAAFDDLLRAATAHGVPSVEMPSGTPGNRHAYLVTGSGPARTRLASWCQDRGLDVRSRGIRPPGTPHRRGPAHPGVQCDADATLRVLRTSADVGATAALAAQMCPVVLPGRVLAAVRRGYSHAGYDSPSHARMALAVAVRARGGTPGFLEAVLRDRTSPLGGTFRDRDARWQRAELTRLWAKAGQWIAGGGRKDPRPHLDQVGAAAGASPWPGAGGGSDLAVLEELLRLGYRHRTRVVGAALMDLAVGAGVSTDTARAALRRLQRSGWLRIVESETARTTRTYALQVPRGRSESGPAAPVPDVDSLGDLGGDHARWRALGKASVRVARALEHTPGASCDQLASNLGMAPATVRYHLRKLTRVGLVARHDGRTRVLAGELADVSRRLGSSGARTRAVQRVCAYRQARAAARATLASLRWRRPSRPSADRRADVTSPGIELVSATPACGPPRVG